MEKIRINKGLFLKTYLRNNGVECPIFIQLSLYDDKYIENYIDQNSDEYSESIFEFQDGHDIDDEEEIDDDGNLRSSRTEAARKLIVSPQKSLIQPESISAICYRKLKFNLLAQSIFSRGMLPFITCFMTNSPIHISEMNKNDLPIRPQSKSELLIPNMLCKIYNKSLNYNLYIFELPFMCENSTFSSAVKKINLLERHPMFKLNQTRVKLIGLIDYDVDEENKTIDEDNPRNLYAPFGTIISYHHKGIFLCNNDKAQQWLEKKGDSERLLREVMKREKDLKSKSKSKILPYDSQVFEKEESVAFARIKTQRQKKKDDPQPKERRGSFNPKIHPMIQIEGVEDRRKDEYLFQEDEEDMSESSEVKKEPILDLIKNYVVDKHNYVNEVKETILWSGMNLVEKISNHIIILGYVEGLDYFIQSVRRESDMPIIICDTKSNIEAIKILINKFDFVYQYVDEPRNANCLKNLNISAAYHVLIVSKITRENEGLDVDAILLASYIQEWYPYVKTTVEFQNENSIKMIETPIFSNVYIDTTKLYTNSYMSGRVFNSSLFLDIGSKLKSNPFQLKFLNDLLYNVKDESNILTLKVSEELDGQTYEDIYQKFLEDKNIPLLCLGVFCNQFNKPIQGYLDDILDVNQNYSKFKLKGQNSSVLAPNSKGSIEEIPELIEDDDHFLINNLSVFVLSPCHEYVLRQGDILYCLGNIGTPEIEEQIQKVIVETLRANSNPMNTVSPLVKKRTFIINNEKHMKHVNINRTLNELEGRLLEDIEFLSP